MNTDLLEYLESYLSPQRKELINNLLSSRTRYISIVLEDIFQSHNISAVLRTAECCGIQDVHIIENKNTYSLHPDIVLGANKWLNVYRYNSQPNNTLQAIAHLKSKGYRIVASHPMPNGTLLNNFDLAKGPVALFMGTELTGISKTVIDNADEFVYIPMFGFTESFNISVSAAIMMHQLSSELRQSNIHWQLNSLEMNELKLNWIKSSLRHSQALERYFLEKDKNK
jgi:tRNA (guanosine-2'-O-)-methyltransferase